MLLRNACLTDIDGIMAVEQQSFIPGIQEEKSVFIERLSVFPEGFFVLCDNDRVIGYFSCELWNSFAEDEGTFALGHSIKDRHDYNGLVLYISSVAILPEYKGKGLGKLIFGESIKRISLRCKNVREQVLIVNEAWKGAFHIYQENGFSESSRLQGFFASESGKNTDGIIMRKKS